MQKIIFSMTRVNKVIYQATSLSLWCGLSHFNKIMKSMLRHSYLSRFNCYEVKIKHFWCKLFLVFYTKIVSFCKFLFF